MLYERWRQIAHAHADAVALRELATGRQWTFAQLAAATDGSGERTRAVVNPQGIAADFILAVLAAWRRGHVVCPLEAGQSPVAWPTLPPPEVVHLKTTSATSGGANVVAFTAAQLQADADNIVATMGLRPDWPNLGVISLAHSYGFSNLVLPLLLHGIPLCLVGSPLPEALRRALDVVGPVTVPAVPALWRAWHEARVLSPAIRLAISAGAPLPLPLEQTIFSDAGLKVHNFYGSTECGGIAYDRWTQPRTDATCVGAPLENVRLAQTDAGCLEVRGAAVGQSYWPQPREELAPGRFRTADLVELQDGLAFLRGRLGDQINVAGRKISPETIERTLLTHPLVRECLVFGVPASGGERAEHIVACVTATAPVTGEALKQFLLAQLPAWQVPREWRFVTALEVNARGKLSRAEWRRKFLDETAPAASAPAGSR